MTRQTIKNQAYVLFLNAIHYQNRFGPFKLRSRLLFEHHLLGYLNDPDFKVMYLVFRWFVHVTIKMTWITNQKSGFHLVLPFEYGTTVCLVFLWICIFQYLDPPFNGLLFQSNIMQSRNKNGFSSTSVLEALIWHYYFWLDKSILGCRMKYCHILFILGHEY